MPKPAQLTGTATAPTRYKAYILPRANPCRAQWPTLAEVGCGANCCTWYADYAAPYLASYPQAFGYNLGLSYARVDGDNFGDASSAMSSWGSMTARCFNTPNTWRLGWATAVATITADTLAPGNTVAVTLPLANTRTENLARVEASWLATPVPTYWVGYRGDSSGYHGFDAGLPGDYANKVHVYRWDGATETSAPSDHLASLSMADGSTTWSVSSLVVRVTSIDDYASAASIAICRADGSVETSCSDGLDNDCDGLVDTADPDCLSDDPSAAVAVPEHHCGLAYHASIPVGSSYQTANVLSPCTGTSASKGGFYYSFGPFAGVGTLTISTSGASACHSGSDTVLAMYRTTAVRAPAYLPTMTAQGGALP
jgi:hypothetical protein